MLAAFLLFWNYSRKISHLLFFKLCQHIRCRPNLLSLQLLGNSAATAILSFTAVLTLHLHVCCTAWASHTAILFWYWVYDIILLSRERGSEVDSWLCVSRYLNDKVCAQEGQNGKQCYGLISRAVPYREIMLPCLYIS